MVAASLVSHLVQHASPLTAFLMFGYPSSPLSPFPWVANQFGQGPLPVPSSSRPGQMMQIRNHPLVQKSTHYKDFHQEQKRAVMITWCFGGKRVAITGSWENWKTMYWNLYYGVYV
ncbi:hypothetical protein GOBAR_DD35528 [Gossypium barbadense]|nr:hypothetical protein GOBAR_DD35528 [Gossypium barbadense]